MTITDEQEKQIKEQLLGQLKNVPSESRDEVEKQIKSMTKEQLEEFITKNQQLNNKETSKCIFCSIIKGNIPSIKLDENSDSVAVLDINPLSIGHTLIIPKNHEAEPNEKTQELAFSIGKKILENLKPKDITTRAAKLMEHTILNVIPIYEDTDFEKRIKISEEELVKTAQKIIGEEIKIPQTQIKEQPVKEKKSEPVCFFCAMANKEMPSFKIDENKDNLAILEINPISKGHTLIIPKNHTQTTKIPSNSFSLAKKLAKKIKTKYKANDIKINPTSINNHALIELIPIYDNTETSSRKKATNDELIKVQKDLEKKSITTAKRQIKTTTKEKKIKSLIFQPKRKYPSLPIVPPRIP